MVRESLTRKGATKPPEAPSTWIFRSQPFFSFSSVGMVIDGTHTAERYVTVLAKPPSCRCAARPSGRKGSRRQGHATEAEGRLLPIQAEPALYAPVHIASKAATSSNSPL